MPHLHYPTVSTCQVWKHREDKKRTCGRVTIFCRDIGLYLLTLTSTASIWRILANYNLAAKVGLFRISYLETSATRYSSDVAGWELTIQLADIPATSGNQQEDEVRALCLFLLHTQLAMSRLPLLANWETLRDNPFSTSFYEEGCFVTILHYFSNGSRYIYVAKHIQLWVWIYIRRE